MRDSDHIDYVRLGLTGAAVAASFALCAFLLLHIQGILSILQTVSGILGPFLYGAVIAYILTPLCNRFEGLLGRCLPAKKGKNARAHALAIVLTLATALVIVFVLVMLVFPQVWRSIVALATSIPGELSRANAWLHNLLQSEPELQTYWDSFSGRVIVELEQWLRSDMLPTVGSVVGSLGSSLAGFFGVIKNLFLGVLICVYILASRKQFAAQAHLIVNGVFSARWAALIEKEVHYVDRMFNGFLMGKLLDSAIVGVICFIGTTLMGFRSAALISVIVGVTNIIPFFGPFIGAIPCALLLLLENPMHCLYFIVFVLVLQQMDGNFIGPRILGNTTGMSSFWVMFAILLFGGLWGITGMVIGVPLCAVLYDIVRQLIGFGLRRRGRGALLCAYNDAFHPEQNDSKRG